MYALITGASSGIGRVLAYELAKQNYHLILVARRMDRLEKIKNDLKNNKLDIILEQVDLSLPENCDALFDRVKKYDISLFINNAGYGNLGDFIKTDLSTELQMIDLNIKALHILTKRYLQHYKQGRIINIASMAGLISTPTHATYSATKSYVYYFSRAVNYELKRQHSKVKILTVMPGPVNTEFNEVAKANIRSGMSVERCVKIIIRGIKKDKSLIIPGLSMKLAFLFMRFFPTRILSKISYKIQNSK